MGRIKKDREKRIAKCVTLEPETLKIVDRLGGGNISEGINRLAEIIPDYNKLRLFLQHISEGREDPERVAIAGLRQTNEYVDLVFSPE